MNIAVVGTGYVGLVTGACFAEFGVNVTCVDVDTTKVDKLNEGIIPIYEPGLDTIVDKNVEAGRLHFTTDLAQAVARFHRRVSRRRHAAKRRRLARHELLSAGGKRRRRGDERLQSARHEIDRSRRHRQMAA